MDYTNLLSKTAQDIKPSGIRRFFDMIQGAKDVIALTVGQPDFDTPWHIREAGIDSLRDGQTYYTANAGLREMRQEIDAYLTRRFGLSYDPQHEIFVTIGGSEAIDMAMRALLNPGDEVIVPVPSFVCYSPLARVAGGVPVELETKAETGFKLTAQALEPLLNERTKLLVLPYPNNPTGAIMTKEDLEPIAELLRERDIFVLSDEIYAEMTYGGKTHVSIASLPGMRERTILVNGFSKAYAMTGWRMGYACAPAPVVEQMLKLHQYAIMCAPTTSQYAALEALRHGDEDIAYMTAEYDRRRRYIVDGLRKLGIPCHEPEGAFYVFPEIGVFGLSSEEFCQKLLEQERVAIVPGNAFGDCGEGFARISYAYSVEHIAQALKRMERFVQTLR